MSLLKELCVENCQQIESGIKAGANRIELCDNLAQGGTTVSYGVMKGAIALGNQYQVPILPIIRVRAGGFVYSKSEIIMMSDDVLLAQQLGAKGVVIGAITGEGKLAEKEMEHLLINRSNMEVTFHMAFDEIKPEHQKAAIDWLVANNVQRILTHGGEGSQSIFNYLDVINENNLYAANRLQLVLGGGVTYKNLNELQSLTKCQEFHGTKIVRL